jgi:hypothetical protein
MHAAMGAQERRRFDEDGDPMARLARDFNEHIATLRMVRNGNQWMFIAAGSGEDEEPS